MYFDDIFMTSTFVIQIELAMKLQLSMTINMVGMALNNNFGKGVSIF